MTNKNTKIVFHAREPLSQVGGGGRTRINGPILDRLIKEKMLRTPECGGIAAMPVVRVDGGVWRVPGYTGDLTRLSKCEAAIRDYLEFLATQFDLADD
jgi:hypothetical protein